VEVPGTPVLFAAWETRVGDFEEFVRESGYTWDFKPHFPQSPDHPVVNVTMRDAIAYCNWLTDRERNAGAINALQSYRLPTRKEWDAAVGLASGRKEVPLGIEIEEDKTKFPWGMEWPPPERAGNLNSVEISGKDDGHVYTAPVGQFTPSAEGIYDLSGNVWEWTRDRDDPSDSYGVLRGGSWMYFRKETLLSNYQYEAPAILRSPSIGFRCVFDDRQRASAFFAKAKESEGKKVAEAPVPLTAEAKRMQEEMKAKLAPAPAPGISLPDPATLKPARSGEAHTNTLGMELRPLPGDPSLLLGAHEVRVQDYEAAAKALGRAWDKPSFTYTNVHPVVNVSWQDAVKFCEWLTEKERAAGLIGPKDRYRLPTDAEWSRAAGLASEPGETPELRHLAEKTQYPWGTEPLPPNGAANLDAARMTNGYRDNHSHTAPVKTYAANGAGIHDLAGNVYEWCDDAWASTPGHRVLRGSSWLTSAPQDMLTSSRRHLAETVAAPDAGFRVVLEKGE
jgi:formylglycine-generating enzyme required for sulfatase activity